MTDLDQFVTAHEGVTTDVDGMFGGQCWDLWSAYAQECHGVPKAATNTTSGYADSVWTTKYTTATELQAKFDRLGADVSAQPGDVAFWAYGSAAYPQSHVAIVLQDNGASLLSLSQNPGPPQRLNLTKSGLLGYLRPKNNMSTGGNNMALTTDEVKQIATEVWSYRYDESQPNMYNAIQYELGGKVWGYNHESTAPGGNVYNTLIYETQGKLTELKTMLAAQTAAIEALSKAMGADPDQIAQSVESAVKAKLDQLEITVNVADSEG